MNFTENSCPVCSRRFTENDDIVVCPICGTPHHRECWHENGHCINEEKHAEGYIWQSAAAEPVAEAPAQTTDSTNVKICPACGYGNDITEPVCTRCGERLKLWSAPVNPVGNQESSSGQWQASPSVQYNPYYNIYAQEANARFGNRCIEDIPVTECAEYIQKNSDKYIGSFVEMETKNTKLSWNWAAGLASVFWCFYRKLYGAGAAVMAILFSMYLVSAIVPAMVCEKVRPDIYEEYNTTIELLSDELTKLAEDGYPQNYDFTRYYQLMFELAKSPVNIATSIIRMATALISFLVLGFLGNHLYKKKMLKDIRAIRRIATDNMVYHIYLKQRGGATAINLLLPIIFYSFLSTIIGYI